MTKRRLFEQADFVFSTIQEMGINLNPSSRIAAMRNTMCFPDGSARPTISFDDPKFETVREGIRDIQQLNFIFDKLSALDDLEGKAKIRRLIKDSVRPQDDKKASFGRDVQFELFVASICAVADLRPRLQEPDVVFHVDGSQFCFAIKRLQNEERLEQRVKEATHQIVKADIPGLIVMDISRALNKENEPIDRPVSEAEFAVAAKRMIAEYRPRPCRCTKRCSGAPRTATRRRPRRL